MPALSSLHGHREETGSRTCRSDDAGEAEGGKTETGGRAAGSGGCCPGSSACAGTRYQEAEAACGGAWSCSAFDAGDGRFGAEVGSAWRL